MESDKIVRRRRVLDGFSHHVAVDTHDAFSRYDFKPDDSARRYTSNYIMKNKSVDSFYFEIVDGWFHSNFLKQIHCIQTFF